VNPGPLARLCVVLSLLFALAGCAVNPVTGKKQLSLISESEELALGAEQYTPYPTNPGRSVLH